MTKRKRLTNSPLIPFSILSSLRSSRPSRRILSQKLNSVVFSFSQKTASPRDGKDGSSCFDCSFERTEAIFNYERARRKLSRVYVELSCPYAIFNERGIFLFFNLSEATIFIFFIQWSKKRFLW